MRTGDPPAYHMETLILHVSWFRFLLHWLKSIKHCQRYCCDRDFFMSSTTTACINKELRYMKYHKKLILLRGKKKNSKFVVSTELNVHSDFLWSYLQNLNPPIFELTFSRFPTFWLHHIWYTIMSVGTILSVFYGNIWAESKRSITYFVEQ